MAITDPALLTRFLSHYRDREIAWIMWNYYLQSGRGRALRPPVDKLFAWIGE
ncbi:hypothetical protein AB0O70_15460 [Microbacterium paraoxydans]|uniref:hypothetical protein n=1 Tax=Microbacterium paraoxydans TaxID=199592 RepID=UPI0034487224